MAGAVSLRLDRRSLGAVSAARPGIGPAAAVAFRPLLLALSLAAQVEAEAARIGLHAGFLEGPLEAPRVALQEVQRLRALGRDDRAQGAVAGVLQLYFDAPELGRVQLDVDMHLAGDLGALDMQRELLGRN